MLGGGPDDDSGLHARFQECGVCDWVEFAVYLGRVLGGGDVVVCSEEIGGGEDELGGGGEEEDAGGFGGVGSGGCGCLR